MLDVLGCTGAAALHSWEHFAGGLRLLTLGSCLPHSCPHGSVVIRAENYAQKCFFGGVSAEDIKYKQHLQPLQCASWNFSLIQFPQVAKKCHLNLAVAVKKHSSAMPCAHGSWRAQWGSPNLLRDDRNPLTAVEFFLVCTESKHP